MNYFMARLIFCFFAEDTDIFRKADLFTDTVAQMTEKDLSNTHEVIGTIFRAMNTKNEDRAAAKLPRWADAFPHVNGGLFSGSMEVPRFSKIARSYLIHMSGAQLVEQRLGFLQVERVKPFGEPAVDRSEQLASVIPLALDRARARRLAIWVYSGSAAKRKMRICIGAGSFVCTAGLTDRLRSTNQIVRPPCNSISIPITISTPASRR